MKNIPIVTSDFSRTIAKSAQLPVLNRYYEQNPVFNEGVSAMIARPALRKFVEVGTGPIRGMFSQKGMFNDSLFVVSDDTLYRIEPTGVAASVGTGLAGAPSGYVSMCCTDKFLFLADGANLWYYTDNGAAAGTLTASGAIANNDTVVIDGTYYKFTSGDVNAGTPDGTSGLPWLVALGTSTEGSLQNLADAINDEGVSGETYTISLGRHESVRAEKVTATTLQIRALDVGTGGNSITTTETGANISWGAATLSGGGATVFTTIPLPDDVGAVWVDTIASFVIVVISTETNKSGRFYWVEPGETSVDALNFATAERSPDPLFSVITLGDQFFLFGATTTEIWYPTGDGDAPFQRIQGKLFDQGIWEGCAVKLDDELILCDANGVVWVIGVGGISRVSNNSIEQRIREAMALDIIG